MWNIAVRGLWIRGYCDLKGNVTCNSFMTVFLLSFSSLLQAADAGPAIVKKVDQVGAELLVIGQRALSKRKRGKKAGGAAPTLSISDYCGTYSSCPVLIVRPSMPSRGKDARTGKDMRKLLAGMALE
eukprot:TRINITY_DN394_c0_g2_i1.p1 TRINITY_DN394_c0_g2~~TRINITY_DN394_c0_g2_i1.p1  ORF type:complete len:127 (+),score=19.09 TRINITY_DN394_c0_g2_i1:1040-1420(+)